MLIIRKSFLCALVEALVQALVQDAPLKRLGKALV
jgi:hypothetical protein